MTKPKKALRLPSPAPVIPAKPKLVPAPVPKSVTPMEELDRTRLQLLLERRARIVAQVRTVQTEGLRLKAEHIACEREIEAHQAALKAKYQMSARDSLDSETGVITRG